MLLPVPASPLRVFRVSRAGLVAPSGLLYGDVACRLVSNGAAESGDRALLFALLPPSDRPPLNGLLLSRAAMNLLRGVSMPLPLTYTAPGTVGSRPWALGSAPGAAVTTPGVWP